MNKVTTRTYENTSKWYHIVARFDTTQSTAADRVRLYVDEIKLLNLEQILFRHKIQILF